jgi:hypothetical protein
MVKCKPDIALFDKDNNVFAVIEIVVTHKPEEEVLKFYSDNNIILIQINLTSDKEIDELENKISNPDIVYTCFNPKCVKCGYYLHKTKMTIIEGNCWKCNSKMKVAVIEDGMARGCSLVGPSIFTKQEIEFAKNKGVIIKEHYSKTANERFLANTCGNCGCFIGSSYLYSDYFCSASFGNLPSETFRIGYHCDHCYELENIINEDALYVNLKN